MTAPLSALSDRICARVQSRAAHDEDRDAGMVTSEYAMGTAVAAGCVGVMYKVVTSPQVLNLVTSFIKSWLKLDKSWF